MAGIFMVGGGSINFITVNTLSANDLISAHEKGSTVYRLYMYMYVYGLWRGCAITTCVEHYRTRCNYNTNETA